MNTIREIQALNKRELENGVSPSGSWHADYRDTAFIYIGGLSFDLTEGDIITIFSQYGEPVYIKLVRDKDTGKSKGFAFLRYEDQRSTDLAVDNLGGATVLGRILKVDHTRYEKRDDEDEGQGIPPVDASKVEEEPESEEEKRPLLKEEIELAELVRNHDDDDPMKQYLIQEKKEELVAALARVEKRSKDSNGKKKHHHRHRHGNDDGSRHKEGRHDDHEDKARSRRYADSGEEDQRRRHHRQ